jgi:hypothetical protein
VYEYGINEGWVNFVVEIAYEIDRLVYGRGLVIVLQRLVLYVREGSGDMYEREQQLHVRWT